jgi:hypothetical protein
MSLKPFPVRKRADAGDDLERRVAALEQRIGELSAADDEPDPDAPAPPPPDAGEEVLELRARVEELELELDEEQLFVSLARRCNAAALEILRAAFQLRAGCDLVTDAADDAAAEAKTLRSRVEKLERELADSGDSFYHRCCQALRLTEDGIPPGQVVERIAARCQLYDRLADAYGEPDPDRLACSALIARTRAREQARALTDLRHTLIEIAGLDPTEEHEPSQVLDRIRYTVAALGPLWELGPGLLSRAQESLELISRWYELNAEDTRDALRGLGGPEDSEFVHAAARLAEVCELLLQADRPVAGLVVPRRIADLQRRLLECLSPEQLTQIADGLRRLAGGSERGQLEVAEYLEHLAGEAS